MLGFHCKTGECIGYMVSFSLVRGDHSLSLGGVNITCHFFKSTPDPSAKEGSDTNQKLSLSTFNPMP